MASGTPVRVAAFGAGWVTRARHVPAMRRGGAFDVVAIADRDEARAAEAARELGVPHWFRATCASELPAVDEIDAVTCATEPSSHYAVVSDALRLGKPTLTEKPFTMTVAEGEELRDLARERDTALAVVHNFQFAPSVQRLRRWLEAGRIGTPRAVWGVQLSNPRRRLPAWAEALPLGLFYDESPHLLYLVRALAGSPLEPQAATVTAGTLGQANTPAQIALHLTAGEMPVTLQINFESPVSEWHVAVLGDSGMGVVDIFRDIAVYVPNDGAHRSLEVLRTSLAGTIGHWAGHLRPGVAHLRGSLDYGNAEVFRRFHGAIRTGRPPEGIDVDDALEVLRLQHWVVDQARERR